MTDDPRQDNQPTASLGPANDDAFTSASLPAATPGVGERPGDQIGPYTLLEVIGEGGFGVVYLAERREPMVQRVAMKIIKPGMDSRAVIARFEQERQALAVMEHPNVAKILDGGVTPAGRPYFVMEHVNGEPITAFADRRRLTIRQRLELFIPVCEAVQHAHHKGLVHRDLKPSNVLVTQVEGSPVPKVIDFGVAKAIAGEGWANTAHTQSGVVIGTPEYMSPEQVTGEIDVDTRADVYSLGVLLYELLTGERPFDSRDLRRAAIAEIQRIIREVTPPKPSTRLMRLAGERTTSIAESRSASRERLTAELRRELDWIPLMALRKERERRYASPRALAEDVRRYLDGRPLEAAPDSRAYLVRKFVRRNRLQALAAAAVFVALSAGLALALWQRGEAVRAQRAEAIERARADERAMAAERAEAAATAARDAERDRADQLKRVSDFQSGMLGRIDTTAAGIGLMQDVRERFAAALGKAGAPELEREARTAALRRELVRVNATDAAAAMIDRTILRPAIAAIAERFKDDPATEASLRQALADLYRTIGMYEAAMPLQASALTARRRVLGDEHPDTLTSINSMGLLLQFQGKPAEAERNWREALEGRRRTLGEERRETLDSMSKLGSVLLTQGKMAEAEPYFREALERSRRTLGDADPDTLQYINNMGYLLRVRGDNAQAEMYYRDALEKSRRVLGEDHPETIGFATNMGAVLQAQGRLQEAEAFMLESAQKSGRVLGEEHPKTLTSVNNLGFLLRAQGKLEQAEPHWREAMDKRRRVLGEEHPDTLTSINNMGVLLRDMGRLGEAEAYFREATDKSARVQGDRHALTLLFLSNLGRVLELRGKAREAADLLSPFEMPMREAFTGGNAPRLAGLLVTLGRARIGLVAEGGGERFALAEANLLEAQAIFVEARDRGPTHRETIECVQGLVDLYTAWHAAEPEKGYDAKAAEWRARLPATE